MSKHAIFGLVCILLLYACGGENKPAESKIVQARDTAILADTGWSAKERKQIKDSLLDRWLEIDQLEFTMKEYNEIWAELTKEKFDAQKMVNYLDRRKDMYVSVDKYFVLTQVSAYFYLTDAYNRKKFEMDEKTQNAVRNVEQNTQKWFPEKIIWECVDDGQPLKDHYVLLKGGKACTYFSYLVCSMHQGTWRQDGNTTWIKFGKTETEYVENDTMFVNKGKGRSLYKIPVTY